MLRPEDVKWICANRSHTERVAFIHTLNLINHHIIEKIQEIEQLNESLTGKNKIPERFEIEIPIWSFIIRCFESLYFDRKKIQATLIKKLKSDNWHLSEQSDDIIILHYINKGFQL